MASSGKCHHLLERIGIHVFHAARAGIEVAMPAGLVAQKTQIDLQGMRGLANKLQVVHGKRRLERCHFLLSFR
jgi:hypothetical protein